MSRNPHRYTRRLEFKPEERRKIEERDHGACIFCEMGYEMEGADWAGLQLDGIMHFIPRSHLGRGIEQNGALGCRWHHNMLDNGNKGKRKEMLGMFEAYLRSIYPDWDREELVYRKYDLPY
ncbi:MAG: hypothetical protein K2O16_03230 [Lachnospiraceae bacterium]|nr:hypothetical protein [Lachnospiraceae bacterium]